MDYTSITPIQALALPKILNRANVLLRSATGSGKTLAFLLPFVHLIYELKERKRDDFQLLIISPTRELTL